MRTLAVDLGERRIGVAVSDATGTLASPHSTIRRAAKGTAHLAAIAELARELRVKRVVVGLPIGLDGRKGAAARAAEADGEVLAVQLAPDGIEVEMFDERFTTVSASRALIEAGMRGGALRQVVDRSAAAVLLQAWLDSAPRRDLGTS